MAGMREIPRDKAIRLIYWNAVLAVTAICLYAIFLLHRIHQYDGLIFKISAEHHVNPRLISALIWQESRFHPECVGTK